MSDWNKTQRLNDAAWGAVGPAFAGSAAALFSIMPVAMLYADPEFPTPVWLQIPVWTLAVVCWCAGARHIWKWGGAIEDVRAWRRELETRLKSGSTPSPTGEL